jgi:Tfp pilus assembly protein PilO
MRSSISLIVIALCIGMYFLYMKPAISEVKTLIAQKAQYTNVLDKSQELSAKRDEIMTKYNSIPSDEIKKLDKIVPETFLPEVFLNDVNNLAASSGLKIKNIKTSSVNPNDRSGIIPEGDQSPYKTNVLTVTFSGGYGQFLKFLNDLESSLHLIDVSSASVKVGAKDPKIITDIYDFEITLVAYSLK